MSEEHLGQQRHGENFQAPEDQPSAGGDQIDNDSDLDINVHDETGNKVKRGKTRLKDIWNLPRGTRIVVECNEFNQPIGVEAGILGNFLGMLARNGCLCSLSYKDWRLLIGKKEKNTNEQKNKKDILKQVKMRFLYPYRMEKWILKTIGERWRQHKSNLKSIYFDVNKNKEVNYSNAPKDVIPDQWIALVDHWMTQKAQDVSETNRMNCANKKSTHTAGPKSFARNREELREKDPDKKYPHRAVLYIHTHQTNSERNRNSHVDHLKELIVEQPDLADTSQGKGYLDDVGSVPKDDFSMDASNSKRKRVYGDAHVQQFSRVEQQNPIMRDQPSDVDYEDLQPRNKYSCTEDKRKDTNALDKDFLQVNRGSTAQKSKAKCNHNDIGFDTRKYTKATKGMDQETSSSFSNHEYSQYQNKKTSSGPSAAKLASKNRHARGSTNFPSANSMKAGTTVFLTSWKNPNKDVAIATVVSCDPTEKVEGVPLGKEFWKVHVDIPIMHDEPLIRPYKRYSVIGQVHGANIAWPSTFVKEINA